MTAAPFDIEAIAGVTRLWVDSDRIEECVRHFRSAGLDFLGINPLRGYRRRDVEFLRDHPELTGLHVVPPPEGFELSPLAEVRALKRLIVSSESPELRLDAFPALVEFRGVWTARLKLEAAERLETLHLRGYKAKSGDLTAFPALPALTELGLVQANLTSLLGISRSAALRRVELAHLKKLGSLHDLEKLGALEELTCETCTKLGDVETLRSLKQLRSLKLNGCAELPSLRFLDELPRLEEFRFVGTNVADGELRPLLRLQRVGFLPKRHYSHTPEELDALLRPRGGSAVPRLE